MREMKKWVNPSAAVQEFLPNEYVAACWNIKCNVEYGTGYYEKNGRPGYQKGDEKIAEGKGCGTMHVASGIDAAGPAANAMWQESGWNGKYYPVFYFKAKGFGSSNHHFCTLDSVNWEKNPNAS